MTETCIGIGCKMRIRDSGNSKTYWRSIWQSSYIWLRDMLIAEGCTSTLVNNPCTKICAKCLQKYLRKRDLDSMDYDRPKTKKLRSADNDCPIEVLDNDWSTDSSEIMNSHIFPLLSVDSLLYGATSHRKCTICMDTSNSKSLVSIPHNVRISLLFHYKLWCSKQARVCSTHIIGSTLHPDVSVDMEREPLSLHLQDRATEIINDLLYISHHLSVNSCNPALQYSTLSNEDCRAWTGWTFAEFNQIHDICVRKFSSTNKKLKSTHDALLIFWAKLKTNLSWPQLSSLCGLTKSDVSKTFHMVKSALADTIIEKYLGPKHISREMAISHNTVFTRAFYGNAVTVILDGTYIYIQKSSDHQLQRSSYSGQKKRNYLKFMSIVLPDGYVLDTIGPFYGNENDAKITTKIMDSIENLQQWFCEDDHFIVDRGFRDVLELLRSSGYSPVMPSYLKQGETQHECQTANEDRQCTKTRWVVESYHGRFKQWKFFKDQLSSNYFIEIISDLVKIITACLNGIPGPIYVRSPERDKKDELLAERMLSRMNKENALAKMVQEDPSLTRRARILWKKLDGLTIEFPKLDEEYLETITCGTYQLKQAEGYIQEHFTSSGDFEVWVHQHSNGLLRAQIHSRHKSQTKYNVWIQYDTSNSADPIKDYYCTCPCGQRTVGMCAHTACILYFLGQSQTKNDRKTDFKKAVT